MFFEKQNMKEADFVVGEETEKEQGEEVRERERAPVFFEKQNI